jgi:O-antigen/teichoic acid export membrane protein
MDTKNLALRVAGTIFGLVAIAHLLRIFLCATLIFGSHSIPHWMSVIGAIVAACLCIWLWVASYKKSPPAA